MWAWSASLVLQGAYMFFIGNLIILYNIFLGFSVLTLSELLSEGFPIWNCFVIDLGEVDLADPGAANRHPVLVISAASLDPLIAQLGIVQREREEG